MKKKVRKRIAVLAVIIFVVGMTAFIYSIFCGKSFHYLMKKQNVGEPQKLLIHIWGNEEEKYNQEYIVDNADALKTFDAVLNSIKFRPVFFTREYGGIWNDSDEHWYFEVTDQSGNTLKVLDMGFAEEKQLISLRAYEERRYADFSYEIVLQYYITDAEKEKIKDTLIQLVQESVRCITLEEAIELGEQQEKNFEQFEKYYYEWSEEYEDTVFANDCANNVVRLDIEDSNLKLFVWYQRNKVREIDTIWYSQKVWKAELQDGEENRFDIYEEDIRNLVEQYQ